MSEEKIISESIPVHQVSDRRGFLPMPVNAFDRVFISILCLVAIHLVWMRFLEAYLPIEIATILSILLGILIIRKG